MKETTRNEELPTLGETLRHPGSYVAALGRRIGNRFRERRGRGAAVLLISTAGLLVAGFAVMVALLLSVPEVDRLGRSDFEQSTIVYTADGEELTRFYNENRTWVTRDSIAPVLIDALLATEDRRFYEHWGIDIGRTLAASYETVTGERQGGSTITMQLARNAFPQIEDDPVLKRKIREWMTALRIEREYSKDEILEIYLNSVPFNYDAFGVQAAAHTYFSKDAADLDTLQAATLVGMLKGTTLYNPVINPEASRERRNVVLRQMQEAGHLSAADADRLSDRETETQFSPVTPTNNLAPYFADYVRDELNEWAAENGYNLYRDGLRVHTTLDAGLQREAEEAVSDQLDYLQAVVDVTWSQPNVPLTRGSRAAFEDVRSRVEPFGYFWESNPDVLPELIRSSSRFRALTEQGASEEAVLERLKEDDAFVDSLKSVYSTLQAGFVAMDPSNGHIRAWIGGRDYGQYPFDHVAEAKRQPGSTFKPFVYTAALDQGISPLDSLRDAEITYVAPRTGRRWTPGNFGSESGEMMAVRDGLALSKNTVTARLILEVGPQRVVDIAHRMGIQSDLNPVPSLALGTSEVSLLEMVGAYGTIADNGTYHEPIGITRIEDVEGRRLATFSADSREGVRAELAYGVLDMMRGVIDYGTGVRMQSQYGARADLAGKTGTTQRGADGWFMLLHPNLVMGSWVGFPSPALAFRTRYWGQGSHNALRIVGDFYADAGLPPNARFEAPAGYSPPSPGRLRAADTAAADLRDLAAAEDSDIGAIEDSILATLDGDDVEADTFGEGEFAMGDEDRADLENGDDRDADAEDGDLLGEDADPESGDRETESDDPGAADEDLGDADEPRTEVERLNRQEREQSNLDEYLERLEEDDG